MVGLGNNDTDIKINNTYNCMYQTLMLLFGHVFLELWEKDYSREKRLCVRDKSKNGRGI